MYIYTTNLLRLSQPMKKQNKDVIELICIL